MISLNGINQEEKITSDNNYMVTWRLALGDHDRMATRRIIGSTFSSAQHSKAEVKPSFSCLLANKFLAWSPHPRVDGEVEIGGELIEPM